jgi:hypothetical protein
MRSKMSNHKGESDHANEVFHPNKGSFEPNTNAPYVGHFDPEKCRLRQKIGLKWDDYPDI